VQNFTRGTPAQLLLGMSNIAGTHYTSVAGQWTPPACQSERMQCARVTKLDNREI